MVGYVARTHRREMCSWCWSKILKEWDHPEDGCKWEDNIRMDLNKVGQEAMDWICHITGIGGRNF